MKTHFVLFITVSILYIGSKFYIKYSPSSRGIYRAYINPYIESLYRSIYIRVYTL